MPTVSVIIPAYNSEDYVATCLKSVLNQTLADFEVIVVDDGSTDATPSIVEQFAEQDARIRLIHQHNQYAGVARNNGMSAASGEFLYFLDSDDFIEPTCLERMVNTAQQYAADVVVVRSRYHDDQTQDEGPIDYTMTNIETNRALLQTDLAPKLFQSFVGWPWDKLFRASLIRDTGLKYQTTRTTNDALFVFMSMAEAVTTVCINEFLVVHRTNNPHSLENTRRKSWGGAIEAAEAIKSELRRRGIYDAFRASYENWIANFFSWNLTTLEDEAAEAFFEKARPLLGKLPQEVESYVNPSDAFFVRSTQLGQVQLLNLACERNWHASHLENERDLLRIRIDELEKNCEILRNDIARLERERDALQTSKAYRIGTALATPARLLRHCKH